MGVEYPDAIDMFVPIWYTFSTIAPVTIVDHCTGGDMTIEDIYHTFISTMRSTHFGIGRDGRVAQYVHLNRGAGGNCCPDRGPNNELICEDFWLPYVGQYGNLNLCSISIEHCNDINNSLPLTPEQLLASQKLETWLCNTYNIPIDHIKGHNTINPRSKPNCPGPAFPWHDKLDYIQKHGGINMAAQDTSILDHFLSFFKMLQSYNSTVTLPRNNTGIYNLYVELYKKGVQLGAATSYEYTSINWSGHPITCQDFGSMRVEWVQGVGPSGVYGPYGSIAI